MTTTASYTNRWNYAYTVGAVAVIAGTTMFAPLGATLYDIQPSSAYAQLAPSSPFMAATDNLLARIDNQLFGQAEDFNRWIPRWNRQVVQRLEELRAGSFDFTGLQVPEDSTVDLAWSVASSYFHSNTPPPSVLPSDEGEVLFIWHKAGWDVQINVEQKEVTLWAYNRADGSELSGPLSSRANDLSNLLRILGND